jgi:hypothetical protein
MMVGRGTFLEGVRQGIIDGSSKSLYTFRVLNCFGREPREIIGELVTFPRYVSPFDVWEVVSSNVSSLLT